MYTTNARTATDVAATWVTAGVKLDKPIVAALDRLERIQLIDTRPPAVPTEFDDPESAVTDLALALAIGTAPAGQLSPADVAKTQITEAIGAEILAAFRATAADAVESIRPAFDAAVHDYVTAAADLPDDLSADGLMRAGGDAYEAFARARSAAATLAVYDSFSSSLARLWGSGLGATNPVLRITSPTTSDEYRQLLRAQDQTGEAIAAVNPIWLAAARLGVPFELNTPERASEVADAVAYVETNTVGRTIPGGRL